MTSEICEKRAIRRVGLKAYPTDGNSNHHAMTFLLLFLLLALPNWLQAQGSAEVTATIRVLPPYPTHLSDYADHPEKMLITLRNNTRSTLQLQLVGSITGENGVEIRTAPQFKSPQAVELGPLAQVNLNADAVRDLFDINKLVVAGISRSALVRGNGLPEGFYTVCLRALDYQTNEPLSLEEPMGCSNAMNITNLEPPYLLRPMCGEDTIHSFAPQNQLFTWSFPAGAPPSTEYTLTIIEMLDPRKNPNDAFLSATTPPFFEQTVTVNAFQFGPAQPTLVSGRRYAYAVTAKDPFNRVVFRNEGRSEVCSFVYQEKAAFVLPKMMMMMAKGPAMLNCSCEAPLPGGAKSLGNAIVGSTVKVGAFEMKVLTVSDMGGTLQGTGKISLPIVNSKLVPVLVDFSDLEVNASNEMLSGTVKAKVKGDVDFLPSAPAPNLNAVPFSSSDVDKLDSYFSKNVDQLVSNLKAAGDNIGFEMPLGIDKNIGGVGTVVAITGITFTPTQAAFDAALVVDLAEAGTKIAFGGKNICIDKASFCGQGTLYLSQDLNIGSTGLKLKGAAIDFVAPADSGSYVVFDKDGFQRLRIQAAYTFPASLLVKKSDASPVTATLTANAISWSDWMATVNIDPFYLAGTNDFAFSLKEPAIYDHSSTRNPVGMPSIPEKSNIQTSDWNGFYLKQLSVELPPIFKNVKSAVPISASANNLIIDGMGVTGALQANNLLAVGDGDLGGWYYSMDNFSLKFINNSFVSGGLYGKMLLPISGSDPNKPSSQLDYSCTLSKPAGNIEFQFVIQPKNDLEVPLWVAKFNLLKTSNVRVSVVASEFLAVATLNGSLDIVADLSPLSKINFRAIEFEELVLQTKPDYFKIKTFRAGFASPEKSLSGFPIAFTDIKPVFGGSTAGISFTLDLNLCDIAAIPKGSFSFDLLGKLNFNGKRPDWKFDQVKLTKIKVDGPIGPVTVKGEVDFFDSDPVYGSGVRGSLKATMLAGLEISSQVLFGKTSFYYWYVDARLKLPPPGIPVGGPIPLSAFGFGGGAYYHLGQKPLQDAQALFNGTINTTALYVPDANSAGFKATIILGMSDGTSFQAAGTLETSINPNTMAVNLIKLQVDATMLAPLMNTEGAFIKGIGLIQYDFANKIFDAMVGVTVDLAKVVSGKAFIHFHANTGNGNFFLKVGEPSNQNTWTLVKFLEFKNYLMVGNYDIQGMPPPPPEVINGLHGLYTAKRPLMSNGAGFAFGASMGFGPADLEFLIFYMKLGAGMGFDISLLKYTEGCEGRSGLPGIDGWYAQGQFWAWAQFAFGIRVDTWFFDGKIDIASVQMAALLRAGIPNPTWFEGMLYGEFNVLGGLISGRMSFKASFGDQCVPVGNPFANGPPLISDVTPNAGEKVSILTIPEAAFNYPVETPFLVEVETKDGAEPRLFKIKLLQFDVYKAGQLVHGLDYQSRLQMTEGGYLASLFRDVAFDPQKNYSLKVGVRVQKSTDGPYGNNFVDYQYGGKYVEESKEVAFHTGDCIANLGPATLASYPFNKQRYLLQDEERNGYVRLVMDIPCLMGDANQEFKAIFTPGHGDPIESSIVMSGRNLGFTLPKLPNDQIIKLQIIRRVKAKPNLLSSKFAMSTANRYVGTTGSTNINEVSYTQAGKSQTVAAYAGGINTVALRNTSISGRTLLNKTVDEEMYHYYFRTSRFNRLSEKLTDSEERVDATKKALWKFETYEASYSSREGFDVFDAQGGSFNYENATYMIPPLVSITEAPNSNRWLNGYARPLYDNYLAALFSYRYPALNVYNMRSPQAVYELGFFPPRGLLRLSRDSAEPPISQKEINEAFSPYFKMYISGTTEQINAGALKATGK
jgi:TANFOR domain-containing protein